MNKKILVASLLSVLSLGASAESPSFSFVEAGYTAQDNDLIDGDYTGYEVEANCQLSNNFYLAAKHVTTTESNLDLSTTTFGVGYHYLVTKSTALYAEIDYAAVLLERTNSGKFEENGSQLTLGVKSMLLDSLELEVALKYLDAGEVDSTFGDYEKTYGLIGANYRISDEFSVYADYETEEDSNRYSVGLRYNF
jgi:predicted porin